MAFFGLFQKKRVPYAFKTEEQEAGREIQAIKRDVARMNADLERLRMEKRLELERAELEELRADLRGDNEGGGNDGVQNLMLLALLKNMNPAGLDGGASLSSPVGNTTTSTAPPSFIHYTDEDIMNTLDKIPKAQRKLLSAMPDQLLVVKMREMFRADDDSISRAIGIIRG